MGVPQLETLVLLANRTSLESEIMREILAYLLCKEDLQVFIVYQTLNEILKLTSVKLLPLGQSQNSGLLAFSLTCKPGIIIRILGPGLVLRIQSDGPCEVFPVLPSSLPTRCLFC